MSARIRLFYIAAFVLAIAFLLSIAPGTGAEDDSAAPDLIFPIPAGQTWRITCGYTLPDDGAAAACGHSGNPWNRYSLDLQHVAGGAAARGQSILAAAAGVVTSAGDHPGLGWHVIVDHGGGYSTVYGHMAVPPVVREGAEVEQGQVLGIVGCTGTCTGPHIHFSLWKDYASVLPEPICGIRGIEYGQLVEGCASPPPGSPKLAPMAFPGSDFDGDGISDAALVYGISAGESRLDVLSLGREAGSADLAEWWQAEGYWPDRVQHAVSGDFNGDGKTDLATLYNYGECESRVHAFLSTGEGFDYAGPVGWWRSISFCAKAAFHAVSGDFNGDGLSDIALMYQMGVGETRIYVLLSEGDRFSAGAEVWWQGAGYWPGRVAQVQPGDFDGDGRSDLAVLYNYGDCESRVHVFLSREDGFHYSGPEAWWRTEGYCAADVLHSASGDFDGDGRFDDLAFLWQGEGAQSRIHVLRAEGEEFIVDGPWWVQEPSEPEPPVLALQPGDYNGDGRTDLAALYDLGFCFARVRVFDSQGDAFQPGLEWGTGDYCAQRVRHAAR